MLKTIIWDNDGILVDTEELYFKASREVLSESILILFIPASGV